jgi:hypothetical protein
MFVVASTAAELNQLHSYLIETYKEPSDQQILLSLIGSLEDSKIKGGLTVYGPKNEKFHFDDWYHLSRSLRKSFIHQDLEMSSHGQLISVMNSKDNQLLFQPARIKDIRMPYFSKINGHLIASLHIQSIDPLYRKFGPFKIPTPGCELIGAALFLIPPK